MIQVTPCCESRERSPFTRSQWSRTPLLVLFYLVESRNTTEKVNETDP